MERLVLVTNICIRKRHVSNMSWHVATCQIRSISLNLSRSATRWNVWYLSRTFIRKRHVRNMSWHVATCQIRSISLNLSRSASRWNVFGTCHVHLYVNDMWVTCHDMSRHVRYDPYLWIYLVWRRDGTFGTCHVHLYVNDMWVTCHDMSRHVT
jgi:hypothetical protein